MTLAGRLGAGMDVAHLRGLDVHGRDHHQAVRPGEFGRGRAARCSRRRSGPARIPAHRPRSAGPCGGMKGRAPVPASAGRSVVETAEGRRVARKDALSLIRRLFRTAIEERTKPLAFSPSRAPPWSPRPGARKARPTDLHAARVSVRDDHCEGVERTHGPSRLPPLRGSRLYEAGRDGAPRQAHWSHRENGTCPAPIARPEDASANANGPA